MKLSVVILNFNRPKFVKDNIIPALEKNNFIDEIIISHGKKETVFESTSPKIKSLFHYGKMNEEYGLTLRFVSAMEAKNEHVMIMDDDIIPSDEAISILFQKINEDERIYGIYGRDPRKEYNIENVFGSVPIVLTRCLITSKSMCEFFIENYKQFEYEEIKNSKPFWNGEDILFSFLSIMKYDKLPISLDLKHHNFFSTYANLKDSISVGNNNHLKYRKIITKKFIENLQLDKKIYSETQIKDRGNQFFYFARNSNLVYIGAILIVVIILLLLRKFEVLKWYQNTQK